MADINFYQDDNDDDSQKVWGVDDLELLEGGIPDVDSQLTPVERLEKYMQSDNVFNRQMVARGLLDTLRDVGDVEQDCAAVLQAMMKLSRDTESTVRSELMEQVPHIAMYCQQHKDIFKNAVPNYLLPLVVRYLDDGNNQVRKTSQAALLVLLEQDLVDKADIEDQVVEMIVELAGPDSPDDYRTEAVALMSKLAPLLGREVTVKQFLPRFCEMCQDQLFHVKKVCAANFGDICTVVGTDSAERFLLCHFVELCSDRVWGVRKACTECFMTVSQICTSVASKSELTRYFVSLLQDQSRWVRMAAFQALGPVISTFSNSHLTGLTIDEEGCVTYLEPEVLSSPEEGNHEGHVTPGGDQEREESLDDSEEDIISVIIGCDNEQRVGSNSNNSSSSVSVSKYSDRHDACSGDTVSKAIAGTNGGCTGNIGRVSLDTRRATAGDRNLVLVIDDTPSLGNTNSTTDVLAVDSDSKLLEKDVTERANTPEQLLESVVVGSGDVKLRSGLSEQSCDDDVFHGDARMAVNPGCAAGDSSAVMTTEENAEGVVHIHIDNIPTFNSFQFWRSPIPEVGLDMDLVNGRPTNIVIKAKVQDPEHNKVYQTEMDVHVSRDGDVAGAQAAREVFAAADGVAAPDGTIVRQSSLCSTGVKVHTASVSTVSEFDTAPHFGSTHIFGQKVRTFSSVGASSSSNLSFMDSDYASTSKDLGLANDHELSILQNVIPASLLENYLSMANPNQAEWVDQEITRHCAYSLPAVAFTLGRANWRCIKRLYMELAGDIQWKVRRTLAFSLHGLALVMGDEITHADLVPVFEGFLKDLDEVRIGVLKHLADFLRLLRPSVSCMYLSRVQDFLTTDNVRNWRFRLELAEQLVIMCEMFEAEAIADHLMPVAQSLFVDKVSCVRHTGCDLIATIMKRLCESNSTHARLHAFISDLHTNFSSSPVWCRRQQYVHLCGALLHRHSLPPPQFAVLFLEPLLQLSSDSIPNVRITLARTLTAYISHSEFYTSQKNVHHTLLVETLRQLQADTDRDVRFYSTYPPHTYCTDDVPV